MIKGDYGICRGQYLLYFGSLERCLARISELENPKGIYLEQLV